MVKLRQVDLDRKALKESILWGVLASDWNLSKGCEVSTTWPKDSHVHITILAQELHSCKQGCEKALQDCKIQGSDTWELNWRTASKIYQTAARTEATTKKSLWWLGGNLLRAHKVQFQPFPADTSACVGPTWASLRSQRKRVQATLPNLPNPSRFCQLTIENIFDGPAADPRGESVLGRGPQKVGQVGFRLRPHKAWDSHTALPSTFWWGSERKEAMETQYGQEQTWTVQHCNTSVGTGTSAKAGRTQVHQVLEASSLSQKFAGLLQQNK